MYDFGISRTGRKHLRKVEALSRRSCTFLLCEEYEDIRLKILGHPFHCMLVTGENSAEILGVTFDSKFTYWAHAIAICDKMRSRKVLKYLAGSTWGTDKETLLTTYKAIGRSVANYAAPVWSLNMSNTQWGNIQSTRCCRT